jgi:hypothetical protein
MEARQESNFLHSSWGLNDASGDPTMIEGEAMSLIETFREDMSLIYVNYVVRLINILDYKKGR